MKTKFMKSFLDIHHATSLDAEGLTGFILENLNKWGIAVENCISQSYDGASVMGFEWSPSAYTRAF